MQNARSNEIFTYWDSLRQGRSAPLRSAIEPAQLRRTLPDLFILKCEGPYLRFRLAGTHLCEVLGGELNGTLFDDLWDIPSADRAMEAALAALRTERAMQASVIAHDREDRATPFEMLLMPLRSSSFVTDRLLGSLLPTQPVTALQPVQIMTMEHWQPANVSQGNMGQMVQHRTLLERLLQTRVRTQEHEAVRGNGPHN